MMRKPAKSAANFISASSPGLFPLRQPDPPWLLRKRENSNASIRTSDAQPRKIQLPARFAGSRIIAG